MKGIMGAAAATMLLADAGPQIAPRKIGPPPPADPKKKAKRKAQSRARRVTRNRSK